MYYIDLKAEKQVQFDMSRFLERSENTYDMYNSYFLQHLRELPVEGTYRVVQSSSRPDSLSVAIYGDTQYWWLLMEYNNFSVWSDIKIGTIVNYFSLGSLERLFFSLGSKQRLLERANRR